MLFSRGLQYGNQSTAIEMNKTALDTTVSESLPYILEAKVVLTLDYIQQCVCISVKFLSKL